MAVGLKGSPELRAVRGVRLGAVCAGIKYNDRPDLAVVSLPEGARCAAMFTRNAFCAAPVTVAREHLAAAAPRWLLVNAGNANAGLGARGIEDARRCCEALARLSGCAPAEVLPFSTGVIGEPLPVESIVAQLPSACDRLSDEGWAEAARAILTTDTVPKGASQQLTVDGKTAMVTGIAKGSGMIRPDMATMLAFVATDAAVGAPLLRACLEEAVVESFHRITVDGDTSTNDACVLVATGRAGNAAISDPDSEGYRALRQVVGRVCVELAQAIVRDGEGATRFVTVEVRGGAAVEECDAVANAVAHSPLVKTALFAGDPNWGRILAAVGRAGVPDLDINRVEIYLDEVCIVRAGARAEDYQEEAGQRIMAQDELTILVELGRGRHESRIWTCDLSYDYVRINAEYRT